MYVRSVKYPHHLLLNIFLLQAFFAFGQDQLFPSKGTVALKLVPANIFNPELSTLDFAAAYYLTDKHAIQVRYGKKIGFFNYNYIETRYDGFTVFVDYQRVISRRLALAAEAGFSSNTEARRLRYENAAHETVEDKYYTLKERYSLTPKLIIAMYRKRHFYIEGFVGVGIKRVHNSVRDLAFNEALGDRDRAEYGLGGGPHYIPYKKTDARVALGLNFCILINSERD